MRWVYRGLETKKEENLPKHVEFVDAYAKKAKKIEKVMMRMVAASRNNKTYNRH